MLLTLKYLMMKYISPLLLFFFCFSAIAQKNIHHRWNNQLQKYVSEAGTVDYKSWQNDQENLEAYLETLAQFPPSENSSKNHKLAYWINAYNALTVQLILKNYPLKSIKEIKSPWDNPIFSPKLLNSAFQEKQLEQQLVEVTQSFLKDPTKNIIQPDQLELSKIFLWFGKDFGSKADRLSFIAKYSGVSLDRPKIDYLTYDWSLNE